MRTEVLATNSAEARATAVERAVKLLRAGEIAALPTETVYGLAADARNADAVARIFEAKERPRFDPLIVHLPDAGWLERVTRIENGTRSLLERLMEKFWPGPLTFVLPRAEVIPDLVTAGLDTVAVRISAHPIFAEIIRAFDGPLAAPSANRFGRISPTAADHVWSELHGRIPLIVDGGPATHGLESTIIALRNGGMDLLRRGPVTQEQLAEFGEVTPVSADAPLRAPGQLPSHYAPRTPLMIVRDAASFVRPKKKKCGLLAWNASGKANEFAAVRVLTPQRDLREAAANLFRCLRELDDANLDLIVAEELPDEGLGSAIMDRLRRAAARLA